MQSWSKSNPHTWQIGILLFDQFSNHCLANALEPFRAANTLLHRQAFEWHIVTLDDKPVRSSSGLPVMPTTRLSDQYSGDILFVVSSYDFRSLTTTRCLQAIRTGAKRYKKVAALDTGSWLLATAGLLENRDATIHYDEIDAFAERFPDVQVQRARWVEDDGVITCGGAMASFELVLDLIAELHGTVLALEIAQLFMVEHAKFGQSIPPISKDRRVDRCLLAMEANIEHPLSIPALARLSNSRQRDLEKRFVRALGTTPDVVYRRLRLNAAKKLLEANTMPVSEIAVRCGYSNASAFSRAFRREFGVAPKEYC
ncbi:MAG: GlxA family transcriptional regulator [Pseudomonadota bacterium]